MATSDSNEKLVFNFRTLRMIIGALAFAFPCAVIALTGKITTSISASYHEVQTRDLFVGFMFVIGALLVSYKGHKLFVSNGEGNKLWVLTKRYEEDLISMLGGLAAMATALFPTARDGYPMDGAAVIHTAGAATLFATVVYFCLIAFLRSVNQKLMSANPAFKGLAEEVREVQTFGDVRSARQLGYRLFPESAIFLRIAARVWQDYERVETFPTAGLPEGPCKPSRLVYMWRAYKKKVIRGFVYLVCGSLIGLVLLAFLFLQWRLADKNIHSTLTFWVETIALGFFGVAWITASQLQYLRKIHLFLVLRRKRAQPTPTLGQADGRLGDAQVDV